MHHHRLVTLFCAVFILSACQPQGDSPSAIKLRADNAKLESDVSHALESKKQSEYQSLEFKEELTKIKVKLENAETDRSKMEEALKKLEREFSEYKDKYKTSMLKKVPGYLVGDFTFNNKEYHEMVVASVGLNSISLSNSAGIIRVERANIPNDLVAILAIDQTTPIHAGIQSLLEDVAFHKKGGVTMSSASVAGVTDLFNSSPKEPGANNYPSKSQEFALKSIATINITSSDETSLGSGSGFIARQAGIIYFYTNAHVVSESEKLKVVFTGAQTLSLPDEMEISDEPEADDLVRFVVTPPKDVPILQILTAKEDIKTNSKILALGNSGGAGVIPVLRGRIKAFGPYAIEVDADVIKGNSGGPVIFEGSNTVVGVVTRYQPPSSYDMGLRGTQFSAIRRICLRPDQVMKWKRTSLRKFNQEEKLIKQINVDNGLLYNLRRVVFQSNGVQGINTDALALMDRSTVGPAIADHIMHINSELKRRDALQTTERRRQSFEEFVVEIRRLFASNITASDSASFSHFNRQYFQACTKDRTEISVILNQHLTNKLKEVR